MGHGKISAKALCFLSFTLLCTTSSPTLSAEIQSPSSASSLSAEEMQEMLDPNSPCGLNMAKVYERQSSQRERGNGNDITTRIVQIQVNKAKIAHSLKKIRSLGIEQVDLGHRFNETRQAPLSIDQLSMLPHLVRELKAISNRYTRELLETFPTLTAEQVARIPAFAGNTSLPEFSRG